MGLAFPRNQFLPSPHNSNRSKRTPLSRTASETHYRVARFVAPPCFVNRGRMRTRCGRRNSALPSRAQMNACPAGRPASIEILIEPPPNASLAFRRWSSQGGLVMRWQMMIVESSITFFGTDGGSWDAITMLVPVCRMSLPESTIAVVKPSLRMYLCASSNTISLLKAPTDGSSTSPNRPRRTMNNASA